MNHGRSDELCGFRGIFVACFEKEKSTEKLYI